MLSDIDILPEDPIVEPYSVGLQSKLANISVFKSPGPDQIPNWFLRDFSAYLAEPVYVVYSIHPRTGIFFSAVEAG